MGESSLHEPVRLRAFGSGFSRCITGPVYSEDGLQLHFASGSGIYDVGVESGNLVEPAENVTEKDLGGHSPESIITSLRVFYSKVDNVVSASPSHGDVMRIITAGSDSRIIFWEQDTKEGNGWKSTMIIDLEEGKSEEERTGGLVVDALKPCTTQNELYLTVSSSWKHDITNGKKQDYHEDTSKQKSDTKRKDEYKLLMYDLANKRVRRLVLDGIVKPIPAHLFYTGKGNPYDLDTAYGPSSEYIICSQRRKLIAWSIDNKCGPRVVCPHECGSITVLSACSSGDMIATGHMNGEICLWHSISDWVYGHVENPVVTKMHWHAMHVISLAFSYNGHYVYSGGEEGVLVVWQTSTGQKSFLPRLGGPIDAICTNDVDAKIAVITRDNGLHSLNTASMRQCWMIRSLCVGTGEGSDFGGFLGKGLYHSDRRHAFMIKELPEESSLSGSRNSDLMCNGYPGLLQKINVPKSTSKKLLLQSGDSSGCPGVDVCSFSRISSATSGKENKDKRIFVPTISLFEFSKTLNTINMHLLATVDVQRLNGEEEKGSRKSSLEEGSRCSIKIWAAGEGFEGAQYRLLTQIDRPHGDHKVLSLTWRNTGKGTRTPCLVSSGSDGSMKIWQCLNYRSFTDWGCSLSVKYRDCPCHQVACSSDGSILALAHKNLISLWDPDTLNLVEQLVSPTNHSITFLSFVEPRGIDGEVSGEAYLVYASHRSITVFNILTATTVWTKIGIFNHCDVSRDGLPLLVVENDIKKNCYIVCIGSENNDINGTEKSKICYFEILSDGVVYDRSLSKSSDVIALTALRSLVVPNGSIGRVIVTLKNGQLVLIQDNHIHIDEECHQVAQTLKGGIDAENQRIPMSAYTNTARLDDDNDDGDNAFMKSRSSYVSDTTIISSQSLPSVSKLFQSFVKKASSATSKDEEEVVNIEDEEHSTAIEVHSEKKMKVSESINNIRALEFDNISLCNESSIFCIKDQFKALLDAQCAPNALEKKTSVESSRRRTRESSIELNAEEVGDDLNVDTSTSLSKRRKSTSITEEFSNTRKKQLSKLLSRVDGGGASISVDDKDNDINRKDQLQSLLKRVTHTKEQIDHDDSQRLTRLPTKSKQEKVDDSTKNTGSSSSTSSSLPSPYIENIDLKKDLIILRNPSENFCKIGDFVVSNDSGKNSFQIPRHVEIQPHGVLHLHCCAKGLDMVALEQGEPYIIWLNKNGKNRMKSVLKENGDKVQLMNPHDSIVAACEKRGIDSDPVVTIF